MDAKTNIKKRLPSRHVTEGPERAPHRSYLYAMGLTTQQIHQPFVGVAIIEQRLHQQRNADNFIHVFGNITAARLQIGDIRCFFEYFGDVE